MAMAWKQTLASLCGGVAALGFAAAAAADSHEGALTAEPALEMETEEVAPASASDASDALDLGVAEPAAEVAEVPADSELPEADSLDAEVAPEPGEALEAEVDLAADELAQAAPAALSEAPALGQIGYDEQGRPGRIHVVISGDTLWDISNAYLGTPWVWPSIWQDNGQVANPHLIHPGDRIWITPTEMRRISPEEADALLAGAPAAPVDDFETFEPVVPAAPDPLPEPQPLASAEARRVPVPGRESTGMISPEVFESSASIVDKVPGRLLMSQEDEAYIGLGESEVTEGDEFTVFEVREAVEDPDTGRLLGYHVDLLGWVRVEQAYPETSRVSIRMSDSAIEVGHRVMPREPLPPEVEVQAAPTGVEGKITFFPEQRVLMGFGDFVYLNRGTLDGLEVGSPLEVYRPGIAAEERARDEYVAVPDRVIASMLVVRIEEQSAVAVVTKTETELELGDRFRAAGSTE